MSSMGTRAKRAEAGAQERGFTVIEVMVAAVILLLVYFGAAQYAARSRSQMDLEESRRIAVSIARARLESLRRDESYDSLDSIVDQDTTYVVDNRSYTVVHTVLTGVPETDASTVTVTVNWNKLVGSSMVPRTVSLTSIFGRSIPWDDTGGAGEEEH
jgi:prepilin-type N-terminal cleavage/methylation domain-containing protein